MRFLNGAVLNSKLYHPGHPEMMRSLRQFVEQINIEAFNHGNITVTSGFEGLKWRGVRVTNESDDLKSLGQLLHREGIAQMTFEAGIEEVEAYRLVSVLRSNFTSPELEDETLDSLLWQAELPHVKFTVVKELMEAEALSGRSGQETSDDVADQIRQALELEIQEGGPRRHINGMISEDQLRRAIHERDLDLDVRGDGGMIDEDIWLEALSQSKAEDLEALTRLRAQISKEDETDFLIQLVMFLLRVALARRHEFPPVVAQELADKAVQQIYAGVDATSVARVINEGRRFYEQVNDYDSEGKQFVWNFFAGALAPLRVASILVHMDYSDESQRKAAISLVAGMPDDGLVSLLEWSFAEDYERMRFFYETVARGAGVRVVKMANNPANVRIELLIPIMWVMRVVGDGKFADARSHLIKHKSIAVRAAALEWYGDHLLPNEVGIIVQTIFDRQSAIRRAALNVLKKRRPAGARRLLEDMLAPEPFTKLSMNHKKTVCQAYAHVGRDHALPVLEGLMRSKLPFILRSDEPVLEVIEAAVRGILAVDTPKATQLIKREASGWPNARTQICQRVLKEVKATS